MTNLRAEFVVDIAAAVAAQEPFWHSQPVSVYVSGSAVCVWALCSGWVTHCRCGRQSLQEGLLIPPEHLEGGSWGEILFGLVEGERGGPQAVRKRTV